MNELWTSRSAIERLERCPRARYYEYHLEGIGIVTNKINLDIEIGTCVHEGLGAMLTLLQHGRYDLNLPHTWEETSEGAILNATESFRNKLIEVGAFESDDEVWQYQLQEALALAEAFLRMWSIVSLPSFVERFNVLAVEREEVYPLLPGQINMGARLDSIVQSKSNPEEIKIISWKTIKKYDERAEKAASHDNQGISETVVAEYRMQQDNSAIAYVISKMREGIRAASPGLGDMNVPKSVLMKARHLAEQLNEDRWPNTQVAAVLMGYFLKGEKNLDSKAEDVSRYIFSSPLLRGYRKWTGEAYEYAWQYNPPSDTTKSGKSRLGKGWERFDAWSELEGGIKTWVNMLAEETDEGTPVIQPECGWCLPQQYREEEHYRNDREMLSWLRQKRAGECRVLEGLEILDAVDIGCYEETLDTHFPQTRSSCHYPTDCPYIPACFDPEVHECPVAATDKYGDPLYKIRVPHHEPERKALATAVGIEVEEISAEEVVDMAQPQVILDDEQVAEITGVYPDEEVPF